MWLGTRDGLNKYDGYSFTLYKNDPKDQNSISNNYIADMLEDSSGIIWIATWGGGLNKFDEGKKSIKKYKNKEKKSKSI
jgi:ligand-binding sensor domain-containing protein